MAVPAPLAWDFEPRSVAVSLSVQAIFHPSVGSACVSLPWFDAAGALSTVASTGPLSSCTEASDPSSPGVVRRNPPGAVSAYWEKAGTPLNVNLELVRRLQYQVLPVGVSLPRVDGSTSSVASAAHVHLGPLLLKGSGRRHAHAEGDSGAVQENGTRTHPARPYEVVSAWTETIGIAGLYHLEVRVWIDEPVLSPAMLERLVPVCFTVEAVRGLPNEPSLSETCEDVYIEVYPHLGSITSQWMAEEFRRVRSKGRPHDTTAKFSEPIVWLLGMAPHHVARDWLHHEGLVVEVHDRDPKLRPCEDEAAAEEQGQGRLPMVHPHGIARFSLEPLLGNGCFEVPLRADVSPVRGDKKRRRAEALTQDIRAEGILQDEARIAGGAGRDKREDTPDYHSAGTVCTIRAEIGAPLPKAAALQAADQARLEEYWAANERHLTNEGITWVATIPPDAVTPVSPGWCPKAPVYRAKLPLHGPAEEKEKEKKPPVAVELPTVNGPWRGRQEDAEADGERLRAALGQDPTDVDAAHAMAKKLHGEVKDNPEVNLDCTYERFGRMVLVVDDNETSAIQAVLNTVRAHNAKVLGVSAASVQLDTRELTEEQKTDPHLDLLTGFALLDGHSRLMVVEGLRGRGMKALLDAVPRNERNNSPEFKLLHNPEIGFNERLYGEFGATLRQIKIRFPLQELASKPELYSITGVMDDKTVAGMEAPKMLMGLKQKTRFRSLRDSSAFPKTLHLVQLNVLYGAHISDEELKGGPARTRSSMQTGGNQQGVGVADPTGRSVATIMPTRRSTREITVLEQAAAAPDGGAAPEKLQARLTRKGALDMTNPGFTQSVDMRRATSMPDFTKKNREVVQGRSEENVRLNDLMGKKREREVPFLDGQQVHIYSCQKLNSAEQQKDWMRKHMDREHDKKMWTYNPTYNSSAFEFSGADQPGLKPHKPIKPNDSYARKHDDHRPVWRHAPARAKEEFRKPAQDVDPARRDMLHEAFMENEWRRTPVGESRALPVASEVYFEQDKIPHHRKITHRPFDATRLGHCAEEFGPKTSNESVHYHGRPPGEDLYDEALQHAQREKEASASKLLGSKTMRSFAQGSTRRNVTDLDRHEGMLKDVRSTQGCGTFSATIQSTEAYHESGQGRPDQEWHARLRENDASPPYEVNSGTYIKRDTDIGMKRSCMSGKLGKAPWRHGADLQSSRDYPSPHDFNLTRQPPKSRLCEGQTWKTASRTAITEAERSQSLPYLRPAHYGVSLLT